MSTIDWGKMTLEFDDGLKRMASELDKLEADGGATPAQLRKLRARLEKLLVKRGLS